MRWLGWVFVAAVTVVALVGDSAAAVLVAIHVNGWLHITDPTGRVVIPLLVGVLTWLVVGKVLSIVVTPLALFGYGLTSISFDGRTTAARDAFQAQSEELKAYLAADREAWLRRNGGDQ